MERKTYNESASVRVLILELVKEGIATHTSEIVLNIQRLRRDIQSHTIRARLSEAVFAQELRRLEQGVYDIYREEPMNSLVSYPNRGPWGRSNYRGNFSGFLVRDLYYQFRPKRVLDAFEGSGTSREFFEGLARAKRVSVEYAGLDLQRGFNVVRDKVEGSYDLILAHFPYWDIVRYTTHPDDLSQCEDYAEFIEKVHRALLNLDQALSDDGTLAVIIGDVRKQGTYYPIASDIISMRVGRLRSVVIKAQHNCTSSRKVYRKSKYLIPIVHEYCLLFSKE